MIRKATFVAVAALTLGSGAPALAEKTCEEKCKVRTERCEDMCKQVAGPAVTQCTDACKKEEEKCLDKCKGMETPEE